MASISTIFKKECKTNQKNRRARLSAPVYNFVVEEKALDIELLLIGLVYTVFDLKSQVSLARTLISKIKIASDEWIIKFMDLQGHVVVTKLIEDYMNRRSLKMKVKRKGSKRKPLSSANNDPGSIEHYMLLKTIEDSLVYFYVLLADRLRTLKN